MWRGYWVILSPFMFHVFYNVLECSIHFYTIFRFLMVWCHFLSMLHKAQCRRSLSRHGEGGGIHNESPCVSQQSSVARQFLRRSKTVWHVKIQTLPLEPGAWELGPVSDSYIDDWDDSSTAQHGEKTCKTRLIWEHVGGFQIASPSLTFFNSCKLLRPQSAGQSLVLADVFLTLNAAESDPTTAQFCIQLLRDQAELGPESYVSHTTD